jgi:hypothetical protein
MSGSQNTVVGSEALYSQLAASNNTAVGYQAGYSNTTGGITAVGHSALKFNVTGANLTAVGAGALQANTANNNTAVGYAAGNANVSGLYLAALGHFALVNSTADRNTGVGYYGGYAITSGGYNTAVGSQAMGGTARNVTGTDNIAIGAWHDGVIEGPLSQLGSGSYNVAVGNAAMRLTNTGSSNTAVGQLALTGNVSGSGNVAIGNGALVNTLVSNIVGVGESAGYNNSTGLYNVFVGYQAGFTATGANGITAVGFQSLKFSTGAAQTAFGESTLYNSTGTYNTAIGYNAGVLMTSGSNNTILGYFTGNAAGLDIRGQSNYVVLADGSGNPRIITNSGGSTSGEYAVGSGRNATVAVISQTGYSANVMMSKMGVASGAKMVATFTIKYWQAINGWEQGNMVIYVSSTQGGATNAVAGWGYYRVMHYDTNWGLTVSDSGGSIAQYSITNTSPAGSYGIQKTVTLTITSVLDSDNMAVQLYYAEPTGIFSIT